MFLEGLKFALGLIVGGFLLTGMFALAIGGAELFAYWRRKRRRPQREAKARALRCATPLLRECAVFHFFYCTEDWIPTPDKSEHLQ